MNLYSYRWRQEAVCLKVTGPAVINQNRILQLLLAMKLFIILLAINLQVSAAAYSQEITLSVNEAPLREVMQKLRIQSGYQFIIQSSYLAHAKPVTIILHNISIEDALKQIFKNQPFTYSINNKVVIIKKREIALASETNPALSPITIKGKVTDKKNQPLVGVNVRIKGTNIGTVTDENGNYFLTVEGPGIISFSYIGYRTVEKKFIDKIEFNISLENISSQLDQVQVIAYGTTTKRYSTSNISTIKGDEIAKQPISNILLGLQGRAPGIYLGQTTGVTGGDVKVRVQGENSLGNGNEAFYVIDGIPYTPQNLYSGITLGAMPGSGSTLNFLNPADVESIEILKDADATAIYGSRAANGAVLITTKKGKVGKTKVDLNMQSGWGERSSKIKLLDTKQYLEIRKEALKNANRTPGASDFDLNGAWDQNKYTDWQDKLTGGTSRYTNLQASISGGSNETQFSASGGYIKETSVFIGDFSDTKGNVRMNLNHVASNKKFEFGMSGSYLYDHNKLPTTDMTSVSIILAPNAPELYNQDGSVNWQPNPNNPAQYTFTRNPASFLLRKYEAKTSNILGNSLIGYKLLPGLTLKSSFGYNRIETDELNTTPQASFSPATTANQRTATYGTKKIASWIIEPQLTYSKSFSFGTLDALIGSSFQSNSSSVIAYDGTNYANDDQLDNPLAAGNLKVNFNTMQTEYRYNAIFGRLNYQYDSKYILNLTARRDGSSRFGSENLFNTFYSVGGAWLFGDENWFKDNIKLVSFGKLRITYGTTGNDQIQDYKFLSLYNTYTNNVAVPYQQTVGILPIGHSNPYLQWEETRKFNVGLDLGLWSNSIVINSNYYRNRSSNQLLGYDLPFLTGFPSVLRNIPALVQNSGWEFQVEATPIDRKNLKWRISGNMTIPQNKLIEYPNLENSSYAYNLIVGQSTYLTKVFEYAGVNSETGYYQFKTHDGKITSSPDDLLDRTKFVNRNPTLYAGLNNSISFKGLDISFLFQYVKQIGQNYKYGSSFPGGNKNQPIGILDRWQNPGDNKTIQKVSVSSTSFDPFNKVLLSDAAFSDASFLRLKNVSVSYAVSTSFLKKVNISSARVYLQGQNLLTFTKFKWGDPEVGQAGILPSLRIISTGIQLTF